MTLKTTIKKHFNLRVLLYILSSCFTVITMFYPISCKKPKQNASQESVEVLRNEQERLKQSVQIRLHALNKRNDSLQYQLRQIKAKITSQKSEHLIKRTQVRYLIQSNNNDSNQTPCDSLRAVVSDYVTSDEHQDSLYEEAIGELEQIVQVKDSTIGIVTQALDQSGKLLEQSINTQERLGKELSGLGKKVRRKQIINRVLTAGILVLAGTTAILVIR